MILGGVMVGIAAHGHGHPGINHLINLNKNILINHIKILNHNIIYVFINYIIQII
jgi:hypothetical protein